MRNKGFLSLIFLCSILACTLQQSNSAIQKALDSWFPEQYTVLSVSSSSKDTAGLGLVWVQSKANPKLKFSLDYDPREETGGISQKSVAEAVKAAEINAVPSMDLLDLLEKNGLKNVVVGMDLEQKSISIQLYEEPFTSVFVPHLRQIQSLVTDWAQARQLSSCYLAVLSVDPKVWGQRYKDIADARFLKEDNAWMQAHTIAKAQANLADPAGKDLFPGSLSLNDQFELKIRKKVHADVVDFLRSSKKMDFQVELQGMVKSEWDLRNTSQITYTFPYCQASAETKKNGSCMGSFDGRIACVYDFTSEDTQVEYE